MKNLFYDIPKSEKQRILEMHKNKGYNTLNELNSNNNYIFEDENSSIYNSLNKDSSANNIARVIKKSNGGSFGDDKEAWAEAAFNKISNMKIYNDVATLLGQDVIEYLEEFMDIDNKYYKNSISNHYNSIRATKTNKSDLTLKNIGEKVSEGIANFYYKSVGTNIYVWQKMLKLNGQNLGNYGPNRDGIDGDWGVTSKKALKNIVGNSDLNFENFKKLLSLISTDKNKANEFLKFVQTINSSGGKGQSKKGVEKKEVENYRYSPRIDKELSYIKQRDENPELQGETFETLRDKSKSFFIYDPKYNLLYLFSPTYELIAYTSVVDGADPQKENAKGFGLEDWCKKSNLKTTPHLCTDSNGKKKDPDYPVLTSLKDRFLAKDIYSINGMTRKEGYVGKGTNKYNLKDSSGKKQSAAIHGVPNMEKRLTPSNNLLKKLQTDLNDGKVPQEYLEDVKLISSANKSYGCIGVPAQFVENPKVIDAVKIGTQLFVLGERDDNYLVQNSEEYFDRLGSDGKSCINPTSLAQQIGLQLPKNTGNENSNFA